MFKGISRSRQKISKSDHEFARPRQEISRPQHRFPRIRQEIISRPRHLGRKISPQQFLQQVDDEKFEMVLVQPKSHQAKNSDKVAVKKSLDPQRFVFQPMAVSTPKGKRIPSEPSIEDSHGHGSRLSIHQLIDEPEHRLGPRLTMSQFIGELPNKSNRHEEDKIKSPSREITVDEEIAAKLPNFLHETSKDFETIIVDDFMDGSACDLNKTQDLLKLIYEDESSSNFMDPPDHPFAGFIHDDHKTKTDSSFAINDSTRCIFKDLLRNENTHKNRFAAGRGGFKKSYIPTPREFFKSMQEARQEPTTRKTFRDSLSKLLNPQRESHLRGLPSKEKLKDLYELLKLLFTDDERRENLNRKDLDDFDWL